MDDNALDVARFLWRQPARRLPLRERALPRDVRDVIDLAAGAPERIAAAATKTGDTPADVLEAARFYVREILLFEGADAYRVLGVAPDASAESIKSNFRALQHWLHPDRTQDEWEIGYATRINAAWGSLRSAERRAAYDAQLGSAPSFASAGVAANHAVIPRWQETAPEDSHRRNWVGLAAVSIAGLGLAVLALRQSLAPPPDWPQETSSPTVDSPAVLESDLGDLLSRAKGEADRAPPPPEAVRTEIAVAPGKASPAARVRGQPPRALIANVEPIVSVLPRQPAPIPLPARTAPTGRAPQPEVAPPQIITPVLASRTTEPVSVPPAFEQPDLVPPVAPPVSAIEVAEEPSDLVQRVGLVHRRGKELTGYLTGRSTRAPPIWQSEAAQDSAATIRTQLAREMTASENRDKSRLGTPVWQVSAERATMTSRIALDAGNATLRVELAWHEGMWLVHSIEAENL